MLNKFYNLIHNKYLAIFKFIFFLRYLFAIFLISLISFLTIPNFFDYEKKYPIIKHYLYKNHFLTIKNYKRISFQSLPVPKIELKDAELIFDEISSSIYVDQLVLYPKLVSIYNYDDFRVKKVILKKGETKLKILESNIFLNQILKQKKLFSIKKLNLKLIDKNDLLINLRDINYSNFGYDKKILYGRLLNNKFELKLNEDLNKIDFKIPDIGLVTDLKLKKENGKAVNGNVKIKIFNTNLKFDFIYSKKKFELFNSFFRSKSLSFNNNSKIVFNPYFYSKSKFVIEDIDLNLFKELNLKKFLDSKNIIKKINSENEINFRPKKFSNYLFDELILKMNLAYGRLDYQKTFLISKNILKCKGSTNFFQEFPVLDFNCFLSVKNKKKFLQIFSINNKQENTPFELIVHGSVNISNKKINFKNINLNDYNASKADLKYFKDQFEEILFDKNFLNIFDLKKIKNFILEIS
tara:strand:+ start:822 stop:2219 length:1398 start_codon:yes stop_codon:yes gene_type:complete